MDFFICSVSFYSHCFINSEAIYCQVLFVGILEKLNNPTAGLGEVLKRNTFAMRYEVTQ